jgi:8-hydroxy-5-deazaflavin:NADPH oxidoreductase
MDSNDQPAPGATDDITGHVVGILGGTGPQGRGLALRLAHAGQRVIIGSRSPQRAATVASQIGPPVVGADNNKAARLSDIVIVTVPWDAHASTLEALREPLVGKLVVDSVNPLGFDERGAFALRPAEGSAAEQAAALLPRSRVTAAFHHVSAAVLCDPTAESVDTDVLVLGDSRADTDLVVQLAGRIPGMRGIFAGPLRNAHQVEGLVANLISINRCYKTHAGIRVSKM